MVIHDCSSTCAENTNVGPWCHPGYRYVGFPTYFLYIVHQKLPRSVSRNEVWVVKFKVHRILFPLALLILLPFPLLGARTRLLPSRLPALMMAFFPLLTSPPVFLPFLPSGARTLFPRTRVRLNRLLLCPLLVRHPRPECDFSHLWRLYVTANPKRDPFWIWVQSLREFGHFEPQHWFLVPQNCTIRFCLHSPLSDSAICVLLCFTPVAGPILQEEI